VNPSHVLEVRFSQSRKGFVLVYGDELVDIDGQRVWRTRSELATALKAQGLSVVGNMLGLRGGEHA